MNDINVEIIADFKTILDPYNGITIDRDELPKTKAEFKNNLEVLISKVSTKRNLIWIYIDIKNSKFINIAVKKGFIFHSCNDDYLLLVKRLKKDAIIPTGANHTLGVSAVVTNDKNELLVIKERISYTGYKLPGGHIDDKELITNALLREVKEETGIDVEFESIVSLGHFYPHQFHKANFYLLCKAKALNYEINIKDTNEIIDAKWMDIEKFLNSDDVLDYNKVLVLTALKKEGFVKANHEVLNHIKKNFELFFPN